MRRRAMLLLMTMATALLLASGAALAVSKVCPPVTATTPSSPTCVGTTASDLLIGTDPDPSATTPTTGNDWITALKGNDFIRGGGGDDTLAGGTGNDSYSFADNFGTDVLKDSSGVDTVNLAQVSGGSVMELLPELVAFLGPDANKITADDSSNVATGEVNLGTAVIERARASKGGTTVEGGKAANVYIGGPGDDTLVDGGGIPAAGARPALPVSNDTYRGFTSDSGVDALGDLGGTSDRLDLRPLSSSDVDFVAVNRDATNGPNDTFETLMIVTGTNSSVSLVGYFGHFQATGSSTPIDHGRIEKIVFSDTTFTSAEQVQSLAAKETSAKSQGTKVASAQNIKKMIEEGKKRPADTLLDTPLE